MVDLQLQSFLRWLLVTIKSVTYRYNSYIVSQLRWLIVNVTVTHTVRSVTYRYISYKKGKLQVTGRVTVKMGYWWRR